ncbi:Phosphoserine phosphatase [Chishuiella changwenlii]|uniref:Phosphoserine phosphatase n=1 Tax=Chishuiella changwenlii TaxID=1434701 RepID=A0A1M6VYM3_9FLAO|nr:HAD family hydrolase [Chishuiella changwenlii]GGE89564.1 hypothetical protein GCM10010984_04010 [Chishuiella changwenlii]SHK86524.1 Phosphoserine phosphatase [Chishuiella changwenlii]
MDRKVVFDFDETLIKVNSFKSWVVFLWLHSIKKLNIKLFIKVSKLIISRKILKMDSHQEFKIKLMELKLHKSYDIAFGKKLSKYIHPIVFNYLKELEERKYKIAISSAAPNRYLERFVKDYISDKVLVIGAFLENGNLIENFEQNKITNLIQQGFIKENEKIELFFTDSYHDLELIKLAKKTYLISPSKKSKAIILKDLSDRVEVIE